LPKEVCNRFNKKINVAEREGFVLPSRFARCRDADSRAMLGPSFRIHARGSTTYASLILLYLIYISCLAGGEGGIRSSVSLCSLQRRGLPRYARSVLSNPRTWIHHVRQPNFIVFDLYIMPCWRRGRDSNPRKIKTFNGFQDRRNQPDSATSP
jgi:hypothetical protein